MFRGSMVALVTPLCTNGAIDVDALCALVEFHIQEGTHAIIAGGTTGESGTLSHDERRLVIELVIQAARERIPVIAGTGMNSTMATIELTQVAMTLGAHAALIMTPAYIRPTQEGLYAHYAQIAEAVPMPIILYNVPSRTACDLLPETVVRLAKVANIIGIKEATDDKSRLATYIEAGIDVYDGNDPSGLDWVLSGAKGVMSVTANVAPRLMAQCFEAALDGNETQARALHEKLLPLHQTLFLEANPIPVKWALHQMGMIKNTLRLPLTPLSTQYHAPLKAALDHLSLLS